MEFRKEMLEVKDRDYMIIRELSYIMGIGVDDLLGNMIDKWLNSKECSTSIKRHIDDYKLELESNNY